MLSSKNNIFIFSVPYNSGKCCISPEEANVIKEEVLQPYREYERKRYEYEQTLIEAVEKHYPFSETLQGEIKEYQQYLGLRDEDIAAIEQKVFTPKQAEYERQQEAERLKREKEREVYQEKLREQEEDKKRRQQEQEAQQRLQREQEEAKKNSQEYKHKVRRYKEEFFKAVEVKYPLNESIRNQLKDFQQFLGLSDEDVAQIEKPILDEKEVEEQEKLQRSRRQECQENFRQKQKLLQQQQDEKAQIPRKQGKQQKFQKQQLNSKSIWEASKSTWLTIVAGFILGALLTFILNWLLLLFDIKTYNEELTLYVFTGGCLGGLSVSKKTLK